MLRSRNLITAYEGVYVIALGVVLLIIGFIAKVSIIWALARRRPIVCWSISTYT